MPRIDIELTSARPDGTWTWRAAGARQPKGKLDGEVLPGAAKVGDVLRAEADIDIDGITVRSAHPVAQKEAQKKARGKAEPERIEILGSGREEPSVTTNFAGGSERGPKGNRERDRGPGRGPGGKPGGGPGGKPGGGRDRRTGAPAGAGRSRGAESSPRSESRSGPPGTSTADRDASDGPSGSRRPAHDGGRRARPQRGPSGEGRYAAGTPRPGPKPRPPRLQPGRRHRDAALAEFSPERKAVADQVLRGGIPAVRQALEEQNAKAREAGQPEIKADALLAVAEELLPAMRAADWRDRAEAAAEAVEKVSVRDLRAVVSGADAARGDEARALAAQLREALERRTAAERQAWVDEINTCLDEGRVVRALRISGRPPEPGARFPTELAKRLSDAGGEALAPDTAPDRWEAVLEAVVASPVRRTVAPQGLPAEPGESLTKAVRQASNRVPALAALLGDSSASTRRPPPPPPPKPARAPESTDDPILEGSAEAAAADGTDETTGPSDHGSP